MILLRHGLLFAVLSLFTVAAHAQQPFVTDDADVTKVTEKMTFDFGVIAGKFNTPRAGIQLGISLDF